jgi:N-methylhydantoinase B/oxoprolinase/acetone carboxylase alpha subunit
MTNQNIADSVIKIFFEVGIDGETMEYIIDKMGMRDQMIKQLTPQPQDVLAYDKDVEQIMVRFTRKQLIEYTREIQERCKQASLEAIKNAGIGFEDMVELELDYDKHISVEFDERSLYSEIECAIDDVVTSDDDAVLDEACNVLDHLAEK